MRLFPVLIALLVAAAIYTFVFERERLVAMLPAGAGDAAEAEAAQETGTADATEAGEPGLMRVVVQRSEAREVDSAVKLRGRTEADREVDLRAETSGLVVSEPLGRGAFVEAGDVLCRLDPAARQATLEEARARLKEAQARVPEAQARLEEARAALEEAQINYRAASNLVKNGYASETRVAATRAALRAAESGVESATSGLESARANIESARAGVTAAEEEIDRLTIHAPFGGVLETETAELGSLLQPGALCATVMKLDPITLVGFVSETDVARVETGARATARTASGQEVAGEVSFVSRSADPTTRTFRVDVRVPNPDLTLRDGETAEIAIASAGRRAHLVPQSALTLNDEGTLGLRLVDEENSVRFAQVTLMRDTPAGVWLTGLPERADIIVIGQEYVRAGVRVKPSYRELGQ
ncbi:efflux RND transporter periplasmic adaptor subunit [Roseovarius sp. A46]|uniref:efflux RND transporter periplasmic adaptor subunit n=1 Tax=Roseovarius sp. A46 TaxID=2109331 RepID=UPI00101183BA|nr:efflux RND transporter periplasmic adaptor subunit [Roseovarius sp. A46]RXV62117.1 efflux RND transporter periplasmic adaptor subunit [Roseovarius sp. A46]